MEDGGDAAPHVLLPRVMAVSACVRRCTVPSDQAMDLCILGCKDQRCSCPGPPGLPLCTLLGNGQKLSPVFLEWLAVVEQGKSRGGLFSKGSFLSVPRSQELHLRTEAHSYLSDLTKPSDLEFIETKRPRLDLLQDPLMRHSPLLNQSQQGGTEDLSKVRGQRPGMVAGCGVSVLGSPWLV